MNNGNIRIANYHDPYEFLERLRKNTMPPLIITVAVTGGVAGKESNMNLPETPEEQADSIYQAYRAGAAMVHIHCRDPKSGYATTSVVTEHYHALNKEVRERCPDIIINNTTGASPGTPREMALNSLYANPEMASLNCGPLILKAKLLKRQPPLSGRDEDIDVSGTVAAPVTYKETEWFAAEMKKHGIKPELEVYHTQQLNLVDNMRRMNLLDDPISISAIFADSIGTVPTLPNIAAMMAGVPKGGLFSVIGVGLVQSKVLPIAIAMGANVRVGFEDNIYNRRGELLKTNAQAVEKVIRLAEEIERPVATPTQAREILGISKIPSKY